MTATQLATWKKCLNAPVCTTGQGTLTLAEIDDQTNGFYNLAHGELLARAIQSGAVKKIVRVVASGGLSQFLSAYRQLIAEKVNIIFSEMDIYGAQSGAVLAQAKAANIITVNGTTLLPPADMALLGVKIEANNCEEWKTAAPVLNADLKGKGITHPTYAIFSGPPGNSYGATWQPCAETDLGKLGWSKVYTGYNVWTPQGQAQAASALLASGKNPDVILDDEAPQQFIDAYQSAHQKLPVIMVTGEVNITTMHQYVTAQKAGTHPDIWSSSDQTLLWGLATVGAIEAAEGKIAKGTTINYPMHASPFSYDVKHLDLNVNGAVVAGDVLPPALQNETVVGGAN
jgi:hypothetical protein